MFVLWTRFCFAGLSEEADDQLAALVRPHPLDRAVRGAALLVREAGQYDAGISDWADSGELKRSVQWKPHINCTGSESLKVGAVGLPSFWSLASNGWT